MTSRQNESFSKDMYLKPQSRLNPQIICESTDEGCPVMEESGTVCGETNSLGIFQEFRQVYDDCLRKLEGSQEGNAILRKLAPFKKLIDDLWEQNAMLVETVEELEKEAACKVTKLQDKLNNSCQKMCEYKEDIRSLVLIIQNFFETGVFNAAGFKFNTFCPASIFGTCASSCSDLYPIKEKNSDISCGKTPSVLENSHTEKYTSKGSSCFNKNSMNRNFSMQFLNQNKSNQLIKSQTFEKEHSFKKNDQRNISMGETDCQDHAQPIHISFNIGRNEILDSSDCCCDCCCLFNTPEANNC